MIFRKKTGPLISPSCARPGLRFFLLIGLFCLTFSAYWWHFERRFADIKPEQKNMLIINENQLVGENDLGSLEGWREKFSTTWNIPVLIQASQGKLQVPPYPVNTLYVGAGFTHSEAVIAVPPLVRKIIGEGERLKTEEKLAICLKNNSIGTCLNESMQQLWDALGK